MSLTCKVGVLIVKISRSTAESSNRHAKIGKIKTKRAGNLFYFGQILSALFGPLGACTRFGTTECPFNPNGEFATAGA